MSTPFLHIYLHIHLHIHWHFLCISKLNMQHDPVKKYFVCIMNYILFIWKSVNILHIYLQIHLHTHLHILEFFMELPLGTALSYPKWICKNGGKMNVQMDMHKLYPPFVCRWSVRTVGWYLNDIPVWGDWTSDICVELLHSLLSEKVYKITVHCNLIYR